MILVDGSVFRSVMLRKIGREQGLGRFGGLGIEWAGGFPGSPCFE